MKIIAPPIDVPPAPEWIGKAFVESMGQTKIPNVTGCVREPSTEVKDAKHPPTRP